MARKPMPGGDRNSWGMTLNEYLGVSIDTDGTIKPAGVADAVTTEVETALSVQLQPAVVDVLAQDQTVADAAAAAVDAEPRVSQLVTDTDALTTSMATVEPAALQAATRVFDVRAYGNIGTADDSATIQAALTDASDTGATVTVPAGVWKLQNQIDLGDAVLDLNGATLDFSTASLPAYSELVVTRGSVAALPSMSAQMEKYANEITFASAHGLAIGDWVIVYNPADYSFANIRPEYRDGQFFQVADVPTTTSIVTRGRAASTFPTTCTISKMNPARGRVMNGTIKGKSGTPYQAIVADYTAGITIGDINVIDCERAMAVVRRSVDFSVSRVTGNNHIPESVDDYYGVFIANSQSGFVDGCQVVSRRSAFSMGGYSDANSIPNRFVRVRGNDFTTLGTLAGMGFHGNAEYIVYEGNNVEGAILVGGDYVTIRDNTIVTYRSSAIEGTAEMVGFNITVEGNRVVLRNTWAGMTDAPIFFQPGTVPSAAQNPAVGSVIRNGGTLRVKNNDIQLEGRSVAANSAVIYVRKSSTCTASALRLDISDNVFTAGVMTGAGIMHAAVIRSDSGQAFYTINIADNDFQNLPLFLWGVHAKSTTVKGNTVIDPNSYGIWASANAAPYFADSIQEYIDNKIINAGTTGMNIASSAGETVSLQGNHVYNPNRSGGGASYGLQVSAAGTLLLNDNTVASVTASPKVTRFLHLSNIALTIEKDNVFLGSANAVDTISAVTRRLFDGDVVGTPEGVVLASAGSIARSDNGNIYRKTTGGTTGWVTM